MLADITNLTGLEKPLAKLIEAISEGVGEVGNVIFKFDAKKIKRVGNAEALREKEMIVRRAEGEAEANDIMMRASKRFALEQYNKQVNLENTVYRASELLMGEAVDNRPVDKDWVSRFLSITQDITSEDVQEILARILATEIKTPSSYSKRVLDVIKNISREELVVFQKFASYASEEGYIFIGSNGRSSFFKRFGLSFQEYIDLCDAGLINNSSSLGVTYEGEDILHIKSAKTQLNVSVEAGKMVNVPIIPLTIAGTQIANIMLQDSTPPDNIDKYVQEIIAGLEEAGAKIAQRK